jgi:hypothetical protein
MKDALVDCVGRPIAQNKRDEWNQRHQLPSVPYLELDVERAPQGARRCRRCAAVHGRYVCVSSAAVRNEWRHSGLGIELIVHLRTCRPDARPRLVAMIVLESEGRPHARATYACELAAATFHDGPWKPKLIFEQSECDFVFPGQVEVVVGDKLPTPRQ